MILSILIPTLPDSKHYLTRILSLLTPQLDGYAGLIELVIDDRGREIPTGAKRNDMIQKATGKYVIQVDCDDLIMPTYIQDIFNATNDGSDCITFRGYMTTNGASRVNFVIRLGEGYEERNGMYYRWPNHLCGIKREIAAAVKFPAIHQGEDYIWSKKIKDLGLLKTETFIDKELYHYDFRTESKPVARYQRGFRR